MVIGLKLGWGGAFWLLLRGWSHLQKEKISYSKMNFRPIITKVGNFIGVEVACSWRLDFGGRWYFEGGYCYFESFANLEVVCEKVYDYI